MSYRVLEWDSRFFGMRVAQVTVDGTTDSHSLSEQLRRSDAKVIYVFVPSETAKRYVTVLERLEGRLYDRKVTYGKHIESISGVPDPMISAAATESESLLQLAYASGHLSRFFLDPLFKPQFKALYGEWLRKSLRDSNAKVFTVSDSQSIQGMVTTSVENGIGRIGLIAIDERCRGQGLGMRLLRHCESYYDSQGVRTCKVVTQGSNTVACKLYEKAGYSIEDEQDVWHVWK